MIIRVHAHSQSLYLSGTTSHVHEEHEPYFLNVVQTVVNKMQVFFEGSDGHLLSKDSQFLVCCVLLLLKGVRETIS